MRRRVLARHSATARRARNMDRLHSLSLLCVLAAGVLAEPAPAPGRVPKVYNALITSNQNLEPSKAYPVYQPVIHDPFAYPFQSAVFYGDFPLSNGLVPPFASKPKQPSEAPQPPSPKDKPEEGKDDRAPEAAAEPPAPSPSEDGEKQATPPHQPPATQSPIPLNQFGLPPQVYPLDRFNPAYSGFNQVGPYYSSFPGFRFYDPYDPFLFSTYANLPPPVYRPLTNVLSQGPPPSQERPLRPAPQSPGPSEQPAEGSAPPEPSDLNVLNYSSKDPSIPNVPPPPPPSGGLKTNDSE